MSSINTVSRLACCAALFAVYADASAQDCRPSLDADAFGAPGTALGGVLDTTIWDDESGPTLVAVGNLYFAGSDTAFQVASWSDEGWSRIGDRFVSLEDLDSFGNSSVYGASVAVYDDGAGPALYVGGRFEWVFDDGSTIQNLAKWDGQSWTQVPVEQAVYHLSVVDLGAGSVLIVGGAASMLPIQPGFARNLGAWNGSEWARFPELPGSLRLYNVFNSAIFGGDGTSELYILASNSTFFPAHGGTGWELARLRSDNSWESLVGIGGLLGSSFDRVSALAVHDDGTGEALYLGGANFVLDGSPPNTRYGLVQWDGKEWSPTQGFGNMTSGFVQDLGSIQRNGVNELVATGDFSIKALQTNGLAIQRNGAWLTPGADIIEPSPGSNRVSLWSSCVLPIDGADELIVGGYLSEAGGVHASNIARWDGSAWQPLRTQAPDDLLGTVRTIDHALLDGKPTLIVGGQFTSPDAPDSTSIAAFNGSQWTSLGAGFDQQVLDTASVDLGNGPEVFAAGTFRFSGEAPISRIAHWDSVAQSWAPLGSGLNNGAAAVIGYDGKLVAGGSFTQAGGSPASRIAQWDGSQWSGLVGANGGSLSGPVLELARFDDGTGEALYAAGNFQQADGQPAIGVARWDGTDWSALTGPSGSGLNGSVRAVRVFDSGDGPELIAAGSFSEADGLAADGLARWDGFGWTPIACADQLDAITAIEVFDDGSGPALYIAGYTNEPEPPILVGRVLKWQGADCEPIDLEIYGTVNALRATTIGPGPSLYIGGDFDYVTSDGVLRLSRSILRWNGCALTKSCPADVDDSGSVDLADLNLVLGNFGQTTDSGDTNGDGEVDLADLNAVLGAFGQDCP